MRLRQSADSREFEIEIAARDGDTIHARIDAREVSARFEPLAAGGGVVTIAGRRFRIAGARRKDALLVTVGPRTFEFARVENVRHGLHGLATPQITAPMPGKVLRVMVQEGDIVEAGQALVVIEAMKMETTLAAESAAVVKRVPVQAGQMVDHGALLVELSPAEVPSTRESGSPES